MPVRKAANHGKNIIGYFPSIKMGRMINFESLIERDFAYLLDYELNVERFYEQPTTIEYHHNGKRRRYTPDFHVVCSGQDLLVECKARRFVDDPDNQVKFEAARLWCGERGWLFGLVTDDLLAANWRVVNIKLLTRFARYSVSTAIKRHILACLSSAASLVSVSDIMRMVYPAAPQQALIPILHMAFHHWVYIPLDDAEITLESLVALPGDLDGKGLLSL